MQGAFFGAFRRIKMLTEAESLENVGILLWKQIAEREQGVRSGQKTDGRIFQGGWLCAART